MEKERLKSLVKRVIEPLCFDSAIMPWEAVENIALLAEVVKEVLDEEQNLCFRLTEGAGCIHDISVNWSCNHPGGYPNVSVSFRIAPDVRRVSDEELKEIVTSWERSKRVCMSMMTDEVAPVPLQMMYNLKFHNIELVPVEIVYTDRCMVARCLRDIHGKEAKRYKDMYNKIYQETFFVEKGIISNLMKGTID